MARRLSRQLLFPLLLLVTAILLQPSNLVGAFSFTPTGGMTFCKCICFSNSTILPLYLPKDPIHPCLTCTRQFCLDQKLPACLNAKEGDEDLDTGTGEEGDVEARCFQRDSPKSHVLVVLFLVLVGVLLGAAVLKEYLGVDVQAIWSRGGARGIFLEMAELGRSTTQVVRGRRRGGAYSNLPPPG